MCSNIIVSRLCGDCGGAILQLSCFLHSKICQASNQCLRPPFSHSNKWFVTYGTGIAKLVVTEKQHFCSSLAMTKSSNVSKRVLMSFRVGPNSLEIFHFRFFENFS